MLLVLCRFATLSLSSRLVWVSQYEVQHPMPCAFLLYYSTPFTGVTHSVNTKIIIESLWYQSYGRLHSPETLLAYSVQLLTVVSLSSLRSIDNGSQKIRFPRK